MEPRTNIIATELQCREAFNLAVKQHPDGPPESDEDTFTVLGTNLLTIMEADGADWGERSHELVQEAGLVVAQAGGTCEVFDKLGMPLGPATKFDRNGMVMLSEEEIAEQSRPL
jgi:hypothetical protein